MNFFGFVMLVVLVFVAAGQAMEVAFTWSGNVFGNFFKAGGFKEKGVFAKLRFLLRGKANIEGHNVAMGYCNPLYYPMYGIPAIVLCFNGGWFLSLSAWEAFLVFTIQAFLSEFSINSILHFLMGEAPSEHGYRTARWNLWGMVKFPYPIYFGIASLGFLRIYEILLPLLKR